MGPTARAASRAEGKEMTRRKWCRTSFHECAVSSAEKKPKQNGHSGNEVDRVIMLPEKTHFLLEVVVPFHSFWFVLLNYRVWHFPRHSQRTPTVSGRACGCRLPFPDEKDIFNELIRWNFPIQLLSGNQTLHGMLEIK